MMLEGIAGSIVWAMANYLYADLRRKGRSGFSRLILFWMGMPLTWLWLFLIADGSAPAIKPPPDDTDAILAEIRRDRRLRSGSGDGTPGDQALPRGEGPSGA